MPRLEEQFAELAREWRASVRVPAAPDEDIFRTLRAEAADIRAAGNWVSGPGDLLSILGRQRNELFHSRLIGWLLNPSGRHGLGDRFLLAFLGEVWPGEAIDTGGAVDIALEWPRSGISDVTGLTVEARADLVITLESLAIVIENKLDAGEGADQCERLYWPWAQDPIETRWVFLTPSGREPVTATSDVAVTAWRSLGYAQVRRPLSTRSKGRPTGPVTPDAPVPSSGEPLGGPAPGTGSASPDAIRWASVPGVSPGRRSPRPPQASTAASRAVPQR